MDILRSSAAGLVATLPMTAAMVLLHRRLPRRQQYALPPGLIVGGLAPGLAGKRKGDVALAAHLAYGAAAGAVYSAVPKSGRPALDGTAFALFVWAASYLSWLPAAGLMPPAGRVPAARNALMIAAHLVWGLALGLLSEKKRSRGALGGAPALSYED